MSVFGMVWLKVIMGKAAYFATAKYTTIHLEYPLADAAVFCREHCAECNYLTDVRFLHRLIT